MFPIPEGVFAFFGIWFLFLGHFLPTLGLGFEGAWFFIDSNTLGCLDRSVEGKSNVHK